MIISVVLGNLSWPFMAATSGQGTVNARHASRIRLDRQLVLYTVSPDRGGGIEREPDPELVIVSGKPGGQVHPR